MQKQREDKIPSYEKINYALRPAKAVERKMLCDSFLRLSEFSHISDYQYIGFGSAYFSDFSLFHKRLGIDKMISIEHDDDQKERFEFNNPFNCIDIKYGEASKVLPSLNWDIRSIVWLDYDYSLSYSVLNDLYYLISNIPTGSMFLVSVNCTSASCRKNRVEVLQDKLKEYKNHIPPSTTSDQMAKWGTAATFRDVINNMIKHCIIDRNSCRPSGTHFLYSQIFNFHYKDGAPMLTVGGVFYDEGNKEQFEKCCFSNFDFYKDEEEDFLIEIPNLTFKELRELDAQLPSKELEEVELPGVKKEDISKYSKIYRHFPTFAETTF